MKPRHADLVADIDRNADISTVKDVLSPPIKPGVLRRIENLEGGIDY